LTAALALFGGAARATEPQRTEQAAIVLIGDEPGILDLGAAVGELLLHQNLEARIVKEPRFDASELLSESDAAFRAFVVPADHNHVRLYVRDPRAQRFVIRDLSLRDGLDAYGREIVAQVIDSSVQALLRSVEGMSRAEAEARLAREGEPSPRGVEPEKPPPAATGPSAAPYSGWFALRYGGAWTGSDFGAAHGPGLEAGLGWRWLRLRIVAERPFSQTLRSAEVDATVQTWSLRAGVDAAWPAAGASSVVAGVGGGASFVETASVRVHDAALTPTTQSAGAVAALRAEAGYQLRLGPWRLMVLAYADAPLTAVHYQVRLPSGATRIGLPWGVEPGGAIVIGWAPPLGAP
jgi:hypothetical protein